MPRSAAPARALAAGNGMATLAQPGAPASAPAPHAVPQPAPLRPPSPPATRAPAPGATRAPAPGTAPPACSASACAAPYALLPQEQLPPASPFSKPLGCHFRRSLCATAPSPRAWMDVPPPDLFDRLHPELPPLSDSLLLDDEMWAEGSVLPGMPARGGAHGGGAAYAPAGALKSAHVGACGEGSAAGSHAGCVIRVCSHPLWPILVDYYFACRKERAPRAAKLHLCARRRGASAQFVARCAASPHGNARVLITTLAFVRAGGRDGQRDHPHHPRGAR